ncbi:MAG: hypothetical protein A2744_02860 [Candidatus Buchananbacteria bacterium RIFCSPHIGHO2_01_FULL_44_11]|uniref:Uncharacterized protein n=1 Tax=Candidatus Buchananbacteria bacterium RIFCSPHIGHO2_01_FULL_44_11 TaxID=1797535 RepID=A0A1G1XZB2_9BACT|nr:MAG: hypothetical protein A2744_02860 [Candidatus Buchananbacteria bacterium RIFCSPHIGHO2_01_FULL_44_11]
MSEFFRKNTKPLAWITAGVALSLFAVIFQGHLIAVYADLLPISVSEDHLGFGTVFPGEQQQGNFLVSYTGEGETIPYSLLLKRKPLPPEHPDYPNGGDPNLPGYYRDLCPHLDLISQEGEGDLTSNATVDPEDLSDNWLVNLAVPAIDGYVAQEHDGGIVISNGEYGCDISVSIDLVCDPVQELVGNGSFELPLVTHATKWDIFPSGTTNLNWLVNWHSTQTVFSGQNRPVVANLEMHQTGVAPGWAAAAGNQYVEMDTDWNGHVGTLNNEPSSVKITQNILTIPGQQYKIKFAFSPRPSTAIADNNLELRWGGQLVNSVSAAGGGATSWTNYEYLVTATTTYTTVQFTDLGTPNSLGTFLDNVSVKCLPAVAP